MPFEQDLKRARMVGAPLIAVQTADQQNTITQIVKLLNGDTPIMAWDVIRGLVKANKKGEMAVQTLLGSEETPQAATVNLSIVLQLAETRMVNEGVLILANAHRQIEQVEILQGIMNLRDRFKADMKSLILLGPSFRLPEELTQDVLILDEPLPDKVQISEIVTDVCSSAKVEVDPDTLDKAVAALKGLAAFPTEQATALALRMNEKGKGILDNDSLWERKQRFIDQIQGLSMEMPTEGFDSLGGLFQAKKFMTQYFNGPCKPKIILYIDEIEKMLAGSGANGEGGDSSGTTQDQIGQFLTSFETYKWNGQINVGPPGAGKSHFAKSVAATFKVPLFVADLGSCKGSLVGESERRIRALIKSLYAIAGEGGLFAIATCNKLHTLPPELRRRFTMGVWYFDLNSLEERLAVSTILAKQYPTVKEDIKFWETTEGWSGANQRDCYKIAYAMNITLREAAEYIVSAYKQDPTGISALRNLANGKFLSASYAGPYDLNHKEESSSKRKIDLS